MKDLEVGNDLGLFGWAQCARGGASQVTQWVKNLPAGKEMQETWVQSLAQEDPHGGGHGSPLQYLCLESPTGRGAWRATFCGVARSQTRLKQPSTRTGTLHSRGPFTVGEGGRGGGEDKTT